MLDINPKEYYSTLKKEQINCPICDSEKFLKLSEKDRYRMGVQTVICNSCSLIYVNPRPTENEMAEFYKNHYRTFYESIEVPTEEYINKGPFIPRAEFVVNTLASYLKESKTFLDIGCAEGTLLKTIERKYPAINTFGVEPSLGFGKFAQKHIKGKVFIGGYKEFILSNKEINFDVIASTHVLEHILNPMEYLNTIKKLMHDNSVLYIEVPNIMDDRLNSIGAVHIGHVFSYDVNTLKNLLYKCGFDILEIYTKNLPAKTPSMAFVCKKGIVKNNLIFPKKKDVDIKIQFFREKILKQKLIKSKTLNIKSILKKIKQKFFS